MVRTPLHTASVVVMVGCMAVEGTLLIAFGFWSIDLATVLIAVSWAFACFSLGIQFKRPGLSPAAGCLLLALSSYRWLKTAPTRRSHPF